MELQATCDGLVLCEFCGVNSESAKDESSVLRVVLVGPPASGKGSQAKVLADELGLFHLSTGSAIRDHMARGTELGERCREYMSQARLVPDEVAMEVVDDEVGEHGGGGFVLDGFPRTLHQAELLDQWMRERGQELDAVIVLDVMQADLEARVARRVLCGGCGQPLRLGGRVNSMNDACPDCGGELVRRTDDDVNVFRGRFQEYLDMTVPVIDHYAEIGKLRRVDGSRLPDDVSRSILDLLKPDTQEK
ncbi:adenylate kinase [Sulfuriroseicoccus oceanibius]|uniref:Adenylate kinase n=1 Tax=Sulfuriroseicoccus oceanibius TaxID=2707525 RepID=A0A6B3L727_9BACT|nr:adenylate kinase [Sulfuriroseicoccus oceanibius]QQL45037.1 adenylate kinase [Sulfuriroseicoccus oceanibius]